MGMEMAAHTRPCSTVPTMAWYAPPPDMNAVISAWECVHHPRDLTAPNPLATTEYSTQISGTSATPTDNVTSSVATTLASRRRTLTPVNLRALSGRSRIEVIGCPCRQQSHAPSHSPEA